MRKKHMDIYNENIAGSEFDWFAQDDEGNAAIFATVGDGFVPQAVVKSYEEHSLISQSIDSPNWGSGNVWSDYASIGLYVYDWSLPGGPYKLAASPTSVISEELNAKLQSLSSLHKFNFKFAETYTVGKV